MTQEEVLLEARKALPFGPVYFLHRRWPSVRRWKIPGWESQEVPRAE